MANDGTMTPEEIEEQTRASDLYSPTVKRVMEKFYEALKRRRERECADGE